MSSSLSSDADAGFIDLHIHSTFSDGRLTPRQILETAAHRRLKAVSVTDHDAVAGTVEALRLSEELGVEVVPGIEISVRYAETEIHLLGYYIDPQSPAIARYIERLAESRLERAQKIVDALRSEGIQIPYEMVLHKANGAPVGRPHIAQVLVEAGYVYSTYEAFQKYLGERRSGDIPKFSLELEKATALIKEAGGLVFWAHPATVACADEVLPLLLECGLDGIETIHSKHAPEQQAYFRETARRYGLLESGGSDCHGDRDTGVAIGTPSVPAVFLQNIKQRRSLQKRVEGGRA